MFRSYILSSDIEKRVFGIIGRGGGADDHAGSVCAVAGNTVRGGRVTAECSEVGHSESELALSSRKPN